MNILFDALPASVKIGADEHKINTDFRCMAKFEQSLLTSDRGDKRHTALIIVNTLKEFYVDGIPSDLTEAINQMWWFYRCGETIDSRSNSAWTSNNHTRLYDYEIDGALIVAAFADTYGIDIINQKLHWWLFRSYFSNLGTETRFVKVMGYRGMDTKQFKGKQRATYEKIKEYYRLPVVHQTPMTLEERDEAYKRRLFGR